MTAFVVLAAGKGTRSRSDIHKALLPIDGKAVLSHLFDLAPSGARLVVVVGHKAQQVRDYCRLAHPLLEIEFVEVIGYDRPGSGPGASLLAAADVVGSDDLVFTTCDTLWARDESLWQLDGSWVGVAPIPAGSDPARWCRVLPDGTVIDKQFGDEGAAWTGLARIAAADLAAFWNGIKRGSLIEGERQLSGGLAVIDLLPVGVDWTDVGDDASYRAVIGYDTAKPGAVTYVLPTRVVKMWSDPEIARRRVARALSVGVQIADSAPGMLAYDFIEGVTAYEAVEADISTIDRIVEWVTTSGFLYLVNPDEAFAAAAAFYRVKTYERVMSLPAALRTRCEPILRRVDWVALCSGVVPSRFHGDFNLSNIIVRPDGSFVGIDWREDFAGCPWGDRRYDQAKLVASTVVHWDRARKGDFTEWDNGADVRARLNPTPDVELIAALSLLNSAPLHAAPLDAILVDRGVAWLEDLLAGRVDARAGV